MLYTQDSVGCYIDGAFGSKHRRLRLIDLIEDLVSLTVSPGLVDRLYSPASDDLSEEDEAIELLQKHTESGLVWIMEGGDLILTTEEEASLMEG